jgi:hypothetical protein
MSILNRVLAGTALLLTAATSSAQTPPPAQPATVQPKSAANLYRYRFLGVYDAQTGDPIEGVEVADIANGNKSSTTKTGTISLFFLPDGGSLVRLRKIGYETQTLPISISPADTAPITIVMSRATQLPTVVVNDTAPRHMSAGLRRFEEHRAQGFGHFIAEDDFRKHENSTMASLLTSKMPGILTVPGPGGAKYIVSSRKPCSGPALRQCRQNDCYVSVYIDNVRTFDATTSPSNMRPDFERISPVEYAAAEFYQGAEVPPEYNSTSSGCGVLLLWTRER